MKKLILIICSIFVVFLSSGCQNSLVPSSEAKIDQRLPIVSEIKVLSDMSAVAFEWKPEYGENVKGYAIYRLDPVEGGDFTKVASLENRYTSHFVDTGLKPSTEYRYKFSTIGNDDRESSPSAAVNAKTTRLIESVSFVKAVTGLPNMIKIIWRPHDNHNVCSYIIEKNDLTDAKWRELAVVNGRLNAEFIDKNLKDNFVYRYRVRVKTCDGIVSDPSQIVEAKTKPLPKIITGLKATTDLPKKIAISWDENGERDFAYYKVYRSISQNFLYTYLAKTKEARFEDKIDDDGVARYYKVSAVDVDELESIRQENPVMGQTLPKPFAPIVTIANADLEGFRLEWSPSDNRAKKYTVIKKIKGLIIPEEKKFTNIFKNSFYDTNLTPDTEYTYAVVSVDENEIESEPTKEIYVKIPKQAQPN